MTISSWGSINRSSLDPESGYRRCQIRIRSILGTSLRLTVCLVSISILSLGTGCRTRSAAPPASMATTLRSKPSTDTPNLPMTDRLKLIAETADPLKSEFLNNERAERLRAQLTPAASMAIRMKFGPRFPLELLNAGKSEEALQEYNKLELLYQKNDPAVLRLPHNKIGLKLHQALAYLRIGEQQNCCLTHNAQSCLLPIEGEGIHKKTEGSRGAVKILTELLNEFPNNLTSRWLLNIAYMTLGEYPQKVPARWLIPPAAFKSEYGLKRFHDVAAEVGLDVNELSGGTVIEDFDGDGNLDVMTTAIGLHDQMRLFHNNGDGTFTERTKESGLLGEVGGLNMIVADYNNDGFPDVLVLRGGWFGAGGHHPLSLLRNNGDGTFTDVTEQAGLLRFHPTQTAVWFDYNNDGFIDLFIGNETTSDKEIHPCELFRNNGDGTFTECAAANGIAIQGYVKSVVSADINHDGRPDLFLSLRDKPGILLRNDGPAGTDRSPKSAWKFTDITAAAGITGPRASFASFFFDYDNDGSPDLFIAGYNIEDVGDVAADYLGMPTTGERCRLYHNNGNGTFQDVTKAAHLDKVMPAMAANFGDLDNDGYLDFYLGTGIPNLTGLMPNRMFHNAYGKFFQDVTTAGGFGNIQKGHAISFGDLNNDGTQDIYEKMGGAYAGDISHSTLFANPGFGNHWITLKLEGVKTNRAALGAIIKVVVKTPTGSRAIYKTVGNGGSFGCSPLRQEIGLGGTLTIERIEIFWPVTGRTQVLTGLLPDHFYKVREGETQAILWNLKTFSLPKLHSTIVKR